MDMLGVVAAGDPTTIVVGSPAATTPSISTVMII